MSSYPDLLPKEEARRESCNNQPCQRTKNRGQPGGHNAIKSGFSPVLESGLAWVAGGLWSIQLPTLLCGSRVLGLCPSTLVGTLPGFKWPSVVNEAYHRKTSWHGHLLAKALACPSAQILGRGTKQLLLHCQETHHSAQRKHTPA